MWDFEMIDLRYVGFELINFKEYIHFNNIEYPNL